jgi:hypothetical protein
MSPTSFLLSLSLSSLSRETTRAGHQLGVNDPQGSKEKIN